MKKPSEGSSEPLPARFVRGLMAATERIAPPAETAASFGETVKRPAERIASVMAPTPDASLRELFPDWFVFDLEDMFETVRFQLHAREVIRIIAIGPGVSRHSILQPVYETYCRVSEVESGKLVVFQAARAELAAKLADKDEDGHWSRITGIVQRETL